MRRELGWLLLVLGIVAVSMAWVRRAGEPALSDTPSAAVSPASTPSLSAATPSIPATTTPAGCLPRAWYTQGKYRRPGYAVFVSVHSGFAGVALGLRDDGRYTLNFGSDAVGSERVLRSGTFKIEAHQLTLADPSKPPLVLRIAQDEKGPLLYVDKGDLGTTDPYVVMPLSLDGRVKERVPPAR